VRQLGNAADHELPRPPQREDVPKGRLALGQVRKQPAHEALDCRDLTRPRALIGNQAEAAMTWLPPSEGEKIRPVGSDDEAPV